MSEYKQKIIYLESYGFSLEEIARFCELAVKTLQNCKAGKGRDPNRFAQSRIDQLCDGIKARVSKNEA